MTRITSLVRDHSAGEAFYTAVVGIRRSREVPRGAEYDFADGSTFGIAAYEDEYHPCGGVMFAVPDVDAAADMARQRGGKIVLDPMDSPVCRLAWCIHPDGKTFALHRVNNS